LLIVSNYHITQRSATQHLRNVIVTKDDARSHNCYYSLPHSIAKGGNIDVILAHCDVTQDTS